MYTKKEIKRELKAIKTYNNTLDIAYEDELIETLEIVLRHKIELLEFKIYDKFGNDPDIVNSFKRVYTKFDDKSCIVSFYIRLLIDELKDAYKL